MGRDQFTVGDPLRGGAALLIVLFHAYAQSADTFRSTDGFGFFNELFLTADALVWIFFVLSGYLLGRPFIAGLSQGGRVPSVRKYTRNRVLRIVPAFWVILTLYFLWFGVNGGLKDLGLAYLLQQNYGGAAATTHFVQGWTVGVEVVFYLLLPLVALALAPLVRRGVNWLAAVGVLCVLVLVTGIYLRTLRQTDPVWLRSFLACMWAFVPGIWLAAVEVRWGDRLQGWKGGRRLAYGGLAVAIPVYAVYTQISFIDQLPRAILGTFLATVAVGAPLLLQWTRGEAWRILDNKPLHWLGQRSYSMYLLHVPMAAALQPLVERAGNELGGFAVLVAVMLPMLFVLTELSFRFVERPFLLRKGGFWRNAPQPAAATAS